MNLEIEKTVSAEAEDFPYAEVLKGWHTLSANLLKINTPELAIQCILYENETLNREHIMSRLYARFSNIVGREAKKQMERYIKHANHEAQIQEERCCEREDD